MASSTVALVTSCTQRKATRNPIGLDALPEATSLRGLVSTWTRALAASEAGTQAQTLYQGRSILDTAAAAEFLNAPWYVVSAGLGLVRADQRVPGYECTVAAGSTLDRRLIALGRNTAQWWNELTRKSPAPLSALIATVPTLVALPGTYLAMVREDLEQVAPTRSRYIRIFTSTAGAKRVPDHLKMCVMPYDERLETVRGFAGTQADFAQRALRHFVEALQATSLPIEDARQAVLASLQNQPRRQRNVGQRMTDIEIQNVLKAQWNRHSGSSARLLRYLRDDAGISCEQKRFSRLWRQLSSELRVEK
jgi:hypothetical protein